MHINGASGSEQASSGGHNNNQSERSKCRHIFLFSVSRTLSNVFCRLLSAQPGWVQSDYHLQEGFFHARDKFDWAPLDEISDELRQKYIELTHKGVGILQKAREDAIKEVHMLIYLKSKVDGRTSYDTNDQQQDKHLLVKNHSFFAVEPSALLDEAQRGKEVPPLTIVPRPVASEAESGISATPARTKTNLTFFPDEYLLLWQPVFMIRHPALIVESWYRAETRVVPINVKDKVWSYLTFWYSRSLYDWYVTRATESDGTKTAAEVKSASSPWPIVVDADDVLSGECLAKLCSACGMSAEHIKFEWEELPLEAQDVSKRHMSYMCDLWTSTGLNQSKSSKGLDMEVRYGKWKEEFGGSVAEGLYEHVQKLMPDYEYLKRRKI
ncbi:hypothetical protein H113_00957 [Trichophyton rubrum MR1459]|uniref:Uncharacterized protein n=3 Tax=Trichophyton TaxID=5550 RepID=A0A178F575_TRIRU|nr:uncharacterized protein TERG_07378 [Trichophyton rubrum CBS 118892]EZF99353.1 hypothetical protein H113_00957 [Trichophyton rubrum MR1459]EZG10248.1 hypothetical protein H106_00751 [Trichophyton rubrum CBS 735.88]KMQ44013.1 P-loop containing nucleoside triphosphate hydrolase [Trichophyton rubrum]OAL69021.1 hypothetical protein A7D00_6998 [Trichophyton violaceum]EGD91157.1 hypothetical protein TERG_07378 [Trichophyton rubrum CBS 118892]